MTPLEILMWVNVALVVLVALLALLWASRSSRAREVKPASQVAVALLPFATLWVAMGLAGFAVSLFWAAGALALGVIAGVFVGRSAPLAASEGSSFVQPSPVVAWLVSVSWTVLAATVAFVGPNAASASALLVLAVSTVSLVEVVTHATRARSAAAATQT